MGTRAMHSAREDILWEARLDLCCKVEYIHTSAGGVTNARVKRKEKKSGEKEV